MNKVESVYDKSIRKAHSASRKIFDELNDFLRINKLVKDKKLSRGNDNVIDKASLIMNSERLIDKNYLKNYTSSKIVYKPKRNVKLSPKSFPSNPIKISMDKSVKNTVLNFAVTHDHNLPNIINKNDTNPLQDNDYLTFKTNFILKFTGNIENYNRLTKYFDYISEDKKKALAECSSKLKSITERKDRVLFDRMNFDKDFNLEKWKELTIVFYEFEQLWQKQCKIILKELKLSKDNNIHLNKKVVDQENNLKLKENELNYLNNYISTNDLNYKTMMGKKKATDVKEIKSEYEKKEKLNMINVFRLEEEIKDLTSLLDKDKEYYHKYLECLDKLEIKKKEMEEMRIKFNQEAEERKLRIAYLNNEKHELNHKINKTEKELEEFKDIFENSKKGEIEFHTQIKILKQNIQEKMKIFKWLLKSYLLG